MSFRLVNSMEMALSRAFLPNTLGRWISEFSGQNPWVNSPESLPEGWLKSEIIKMRDRHMFLAGPSQQQPTVGRDLTMGPPIHPLWLTFSGNCAPTTGGPG